MPRILLVDDDIAEISAVKRVLAKSGLTPVLATNASDARVAVAHRRPDLLIVGATCENGEAVALAVQLGGKPATRDLPVIVLGQTEAAPPRAVVLPRPVDPFALSEQVVDLLARPKPPADPLPPAPQGPVLERVEYRAPRPTVIVPDYLQASEAELTPVEATPHEAPTPAPGLSSERAFLDSTFLERPALERRGPPVALPRALERRAQPSDPANARKAAVEALRARAEELRRGPEAAPSPAPAEAAAGLDALFELQPPAGVEHGEGGATETTAPGGEPAGLEELDPAWLMPLSDEVTPVTPERSATSAAEASLGYFEVGDEADGAPPFGEPAGAQAAPLFGDAGVELEPPQGVEAEPPAPPAEALPEESFADLDRIGPTGTLPGFSTSGREELKPRARRMVEELEEQARAEAALEDEVVARRQREAETLALTQAAEAAVAEARRAREAESQAIERARAEARAIAEAEVASARQLAEAEAARIRQLADEETARVRQLAEADAARVRLRAEEETARARRLVEAEAARARQAAEAEAEAVRARRAVEAEAERVRLSAEAEARRARQAVEVEAAQARQAEQRAELEAAQARQAEQRAELEAAQARQAEQRADLEAAQARQAEQRADLEAAQARQAEQRAEAEATRARQAEERAEVEAVRAREAEEQLRAEAAARAEALQRAGEEAVRAREAEASVQKEFAAAARRAQEAEVLARAASVASQEATRLAEVEAERAHQAEERLRSEAAARAEALLKAGEEAARARQAEQAAQRESEARRLLEGEIERLRVQREVDHAAHVAELERARVGASDQAARVEAERQVALRAEVEAAVEQATQRAAAEAEARGREALEAAQARLEAEATARAVAEEARRHAEETLRRLAEERLAAAAEAPAQPRPLRLPEAAAAPWPAQPPAWTEPYQPAGAAEAAAPAAERGPALAEGEPLPLPPAELRSGHLDDLAFPRWLWLGARAQVTGRLDVAGEAARSLWFEGGRLLGAASNVPAERVEEVALRLGLLTREQHRAIAGAAAALPPRRAAVLLVERGYLKPGELTALVRRRTEEVAFGVFSEQGARFRWVPDPVPPDERVAPERPLLALALEGIRRRWQTPRLEAVLGGPDTLLAPVAGAPDDAEVGLSADDRRCLALADGLRTAEEIVASSPLDPLSTRQLLAFAVLIKRIEPRLVQAGRPRGQVAAAIDLARLQSKLEQVRRDDYFTILGVGRLCTPHEVREAADRILEELAPERFEGRREEGLGAKLVEIQHVVAEARAVLVDDGLRSEYLRGLGGSA